MIPKIIHFCWVGGNPMSKKVKQFIDICKSKNPDYEIIVWDESNFDINANRYCKEAYSQKKWAFVSDYIRLKVLFDYGGIYLDTDVETVKNFDPLLVNKAFSGFEQDNAIPTGTMGAEPGNRWIKINLDYYNDRSFFLPDGGMDLTTNVTTITRLTKENYSIVLNDTFQNLGDVTFYPFDYLCAKKHTNGKIYKTKNTITIHHFSGSWLSGKNKFIRFLKNNHMNWVVSFTVKLKRLLRRASKNDR